MFLEKDGVIYLTRGDTASFTVATQDAQGNDYEMQDGDQLVLTVKVAPKASLPAVFTVTSTTNTIAIQPSVTASLRTGKYSADIELKTSSGNIFTVWPTTFSGKMLSSEQNWKNFWITPEVTR